MKSADREAYNLTVDYTKPSSTSGVVLESSQNKKGDAETETKTTKYIDSIPLPTYDYEEEEDDESFFTKYKWWIIGGIAMVMLVILLVVFLYPRSRGKIYSRSNYSKNVLY